MLLSFISDRPSRQKYAVTLVEPIIRCMNAFYNNLEIVSYIVSVLAILVIEAGKP